MQEQLHETEAEMLGPLFNIQVLAEASCYASRSTHTWWVLIHDGFLHRRFASSEIRSWFE
jgi:hypothetical protein